MYIFTANLLNLLTAVFLYYLFIILVILSYIMYTYVYLCMYVNYSHLQHVLSGKANAPCLVLKFRDVSVMLDCSLDMSSLQHFLPLKRIPR